MTESSASRKRVVLAFWFIAIIYVLSIDLKGVWTDEGNRYMLMAGGQTWEQYNHSGSFGSFPQVITAVRTMSLYVPLFYLIDNAVIRLAQSHSDLLLRLVNVLWLLLGLQGLLRFFRNYSESTRFFAMAVFALNGYMLMHVMQIREYPMYLALLIWSSCFLFELLELASDVPWRRRVPTLVGYGVLMGLFFYSQPYSVFALAAQVLIVLTWNRNRLASFRRMALSYAIAAAITAPWIVVFLVRYHGTINPGVYDRRASTLALLLQSLKWGFSALLIYGSWDGHPLMQVFLVLLVAGVPAIWILAARSGEPPDRRAIYALLTSVLFFVFQIAFSLNQPLSLWSRYFVSYYFGYVVLATCAFSSLRNYAEKQRRRRWIVLSTAALLFVCIVGLEQIRLYREDPYMDTGMTAACNWRVTSRAMLRYVRPDETIAYYHPLLAWTISIDYPLFPNELSYSDIDSGRFARVPALWVMDHGYVPDETKQTLDHLHSFGYEITKTADLGCQCRLFRLELPEGVSSRIAGPPPAGGNGTVGANDATCTATPPSGYNAFVAQVSPANATKVGIFRAGLWQLDHPSGTALRNPATTLSGSFGSSGEVPVVGDWNGSGRTKVGVWHNGKWQLDRTALRNTVQPRRSRAGWDGQEIYRWLGIGMVRGRPRWGSSATGYGSWI